VLSLNGISVNKKRIDILNSKTAGEGPVVYWMSRDQRARDNWALVYAAGQALERSTGLIVVFAITDKFPGASIRHYDFMLRGLMLVEKDLAAKNIAFALITGNPPESLPEYLHSIKASLVVCDFDPLKIKKSWKRELLKNIQVPLYEVDAHNVVPCKVVSDKIEFGAYTIRPKIKRLIGEFLEEFPEIPVFGKQKMHQGMPADWPGVKKKLFQHIDSGVKIVDWIIPGENAAAKTFQLFLNDRYPVYNDKRNDPNSQAVSDMSPYLHFGQIASQRMALEMTKKFPSDQNTEAFLEELIVRKELSDNFCHYNPDYDSFEGFPRWARESLNAHRKDEREHIYTVDQFEQAITHDELWNAAQKEMVNRGKMHGYMRMYWAKKILEWSATPEDALETAIMLNDKYELDGRDPNGYTGCAWSIGGVHDRAWGERPVFGKVRYMNDKGARRKFDVGKYIQNNIG
jgi:deoxyribodipyrimidine photo-lyase